jgi:hypothetical protein
MNREQRIKDVTKQLAELHADKNNDFEITHEQADMLLMGVLLDLGYSELVEAYKNVGKWYA